MRDEEIIELYFNRNEQAIEETDIKYGNYLASIAGNILKCPEDVEETLDDTYMKAWKRIPPTRPQIFRIFLGKITRNIAFNKYENMTAKKRGGGAIAEVIDELEECIPDSSDVEGTILGSELSSIIRDFVNTLPQKEAYIFSCRYFYTEDISSIAKKFNMTSNNVSVTLSRLRGKLQKRLVREGYLAS
ncbi:MAG: sigma-70 family RNA polymerase sigma factor [Pseudobutyrivibrio ruminis]|uniref:Sigma-70 family RNA polymerase sigma factor n=1 Tax=Pseudobutyrivibrio ruminis TaxID=46206 RepID=A0A927YPT4_9FIRM|nr:sigma-70 family RNA polymerase sigma factor [Pseudobutyrivibrio ruminis]